MKLPFLKHSNIHVGCEFSLIPRIPPGLSVGLPPVPPRPSADGRGVLGAVHFLSIAISGHIRRRTARRAPHDDDDDVDDDDMTEDDVTKYHI